MHAMLQWLGGAEFGGVSGGTDNYGGEGGSPPSSDPSHLQQMVSVHFSLLLKILPSSCFMLPEMFFLS